MGIGCRVQGAHTETALANLARCFERRLCVAFQAILAKFDVKRVKICGTFWHFDVKKYRCLLVRGAYQKAALANLRGEL